MNPRWFMRMSQWARRPPSYRRVVFVLGIGALCVAIALIQWLGLWPDALTLPTRPGRLR